MVRTACVFLLVVAATANTSHYGNPSGGCMSDEEAVRVEGVSGDFCSPQCSDSGSCPPDVPSGDTAMPQCVLQTTTGSKYCALVCTPSSMRLAGECGTGTCQSIQGTGICTYSAASKNAMNTTAVLQTLVVL